MPFDVNSINFLCIRLEALYLFFLYAGVWMLLNRDFLSSISNLGSFK